MKNAQSAVANTQRNKMSDKQDLDRLPIWTQHEMLSALFAGFVIGIAVGLIF